MPAPEEVTVEQIVKQEDWTNNDGGQMTTYELLFQGDTRTWKAHRNHAKDHPEPVPGQLFKGWRNPEKGTFGIAAPLKGNAPPRRGGGGRDDATGKSIERQVAAKAAAEMAAVVATDNPGVMAANFEGLFDAVLAKIQAQNGGQPAQQEMASAGDATGDDKIAF